MSLDQAQHKRLVNIKQLYNQALAQLNKNTSTGRILAVIIFDLAIESTLRLVYDNLGGKYLSNDITYYVLCNEVKTLLKQGVPRRSDILKVHDLRNDAQHRGKTPSKTDTQDCRTYTHAFLSDIVNLVWSIDFNSLRLSDLIQDQQLKSYIARAENFLANKDYKNSTYYALAGLQRSIFDAEYKIFQDTLTHIEYDIDDQINGRATIPNYGTVIVSRTGENVHKSPE